MTMLKKNPPEPVVLGASPVARAESCCATGGRNCFAPAGVVKPTSASTEQARATRIFIFPPKATGRRLRDTGIFSARSTRASFDERDALSLVLEHRPVVLPAAVLALVLRGRL